MDDMIYQIRSYLDRRFWHTSGGIHFGVMDDYGTIVQSNARPLEELIS